MVRFGRRDEHIRGKICIQNALGTLEKWADIIEQGLSRISAEFSLEKALWVAYLKDRKVLPFCGEDRKRS